MEQDHTSRSWNRSKCLQCTEVICPALEFSTPYAHSVVDVGSFLRNASEISAQTYTTASRLRTYLNRLSKISVDVESYGSSGMDVRRGHSDGFQLSNV